MVDKRKASPMARLELGDPGEEQTYTLRLDINALIAFEEVSGKPLRDIGVDKGMGLVELRQLLWATMLTEHPDMDIKDVGKLIHIHNMEDVTRAINELLEGKNG